MKNPEEKMRPEEIPEEEKRELRRRSHTLISRFCSYAALVVILVDLAAYVLGRADGFFGQFGIMAAIALLAIAAINDPSR